MNKVSKLTLLSTVLALTACGGSNSVVVSTFPDANTKTDSNIDTQKEKEKEKEKEQEQKQNSTITRESSQKVFSVKSDNLTSIISKAEENINGEIDVSNYDAIEKAYNSAISTNTNPNRSASSKKVNRSSTNSFGIIVPDSGEKLSVTEKKFNILTMTSNLFKKGADIVKKFGDELKNQGKEDVATQTLVQSVKAFNMNAIIDVSNTEISIDIIVSKVEENFNEIKSTIEEKLNSDFKKKNVDFSKYDFGENLSFIVNENNVITGMRVTNDFDEDFAKYYNPEDTDRTKYQSIFYTDFNFDDFKEVNGIQVATNKKTYNIVNSVVVSKDGKFVESYEVPAFASENGKYTGKSDFNIDNMWKTWEVVTDKKGLYHCQDLICDDFSHDEEKKQSWENIQKITKDDIKKAMENDESIDIGNGYKLTFVGSYPLNIERTLKLMGNTVNLSYSQFGTTNDFFSIDSKTFSKYGITTNVNSSEGYAFSGGNTDYKIDIEDIDEDLVFKGKAFGSATLGSNDDCFDKAIDISGTATLTVTPNVNERETLVADFDDYYKITITKEKEYDPSNCIQNCQGNISYDGSKIGEKYKEYVYSDSNLGRLDKANFKYYGDNGKPEEAVGNISINGANADNSRDLDIEFAFGAKKQ